jgi:DNA-binding NarL/FixJ family response regulator
VTEPGAAVRPRLGDSGDAAESRDAVAVMTVDDQAVFRRIARDVVAATSGFRPVGEAESGEEALWAVGEAAPELLLLDVRLGGMDGVETARQLSSAHPNLVIVLITADDPEHLPGDADSCGAATVVRKENFGPRMLRTLWAAYGRPRRSGTETD